MMTVIHVAIAKRAGKVKRRTRKMSSLVERAVELLETHRWETEWRVIDDERVPVNVCGDCGKQEGQDHEPNCKIQAWLADAAVPREMVVRVQFNRLIGGIGWCGTLNQDISII